MNDPRITDEVVDAAERTFWGLYGTEESFVVITSSYAMRKTLEAVRPHLAPQPVDREALVTLLHDYDMPHEWGDRRCPMYACEQVYPPRADAILAFLNGTAM